MPDWIYQGAYPVPAGVINPDPWKFNGFDVSTMYQDWARSNCLVFCSYILWVSFLCCFGLLVLLSFVLTCA